MDWPQAVLHPTHDLALSKDQDDRACENEAKEGKEGDDEL
jgi:hypothetical protein